MATKPEDKKTEEVAKIKESKKVFKTAEQGVKILVFRTGNEVKVGKKLSEKMIKSKKAKLA